jgi:sulfur-carrier protein adenylyltransferase/sulfurtransferase
MNTHAFETITVEALKDYMNSTHEKDYILVDVRQPGEYMQTHIPGALLVPLPEFQSKINSLPKDRDIVFYCLSGSRSRTAAMMAADQEITQKNIYSLEGGISKWTGTSLGNVPKVEIFAKSHTIPQLIKIAICMEKGAVKFYEKMQEISILDDSRNIFLQLAKEEMTHAKTLYELLMGYSKEQFHNFEDFYEELSSDMVEGGDTLSDLMGYIHGIQKYGCINLLDLAMDMEFVSYDLYRTMANQKSAEKDVESILLKIAQAEKSHMKLIADSYGLCPDGKTG